MTDHGKNPFSLTKANDLSDDQIQNLWVDVGSINAHDTLFNSGRFTSPMPTFILGGKGSGKTHLMRYASYPLQKLRFKQSGSSLLKGLSSDGYIGIYLRCSGLESGRFSGKGQSDEAWLDIFAYYLELSLGAALLRIVSELYSEDDVCVQEADLCRSIDSCFDGSPSEATSIDGLIANLESRRRKLDFEVNNAAFTGKLDPKITVSRGGLTFGIPKHLSNSIPELSSAQFSYQLDEFENLTLLQQQHVNTLVRERENPATLKIGARQFGIKTHKTLSAEEENIRDSEFDELRLDQRFRQNEKTYTELVNKLVARRLESVRPLTVNGRERKLGDWFEEPDSAWASTDFMKMVKHKQSLERPHMLRLGEALRDHIASGDIPGISTIDEVDVVLRNVSQDKFPLLEKLNTTLIFNAWANGRDILQESKLTKSDCDVFVKGGSAQKYKHKLSHYKTDLIAQMLRSSGSRQIYAGLKTFTRMSEGQPRALITLLKQTFDWATFQGERPFDADKVSIEAQSKGALAASEWFHNSMQTSGEEGRAILIAIDRLAQLFRINRFADNPIECSLIGFSVSYSSMSETAAQTIKLAVDRSFLVEVLGGQQDRNSEQVTNKYQLNRMLVPKWGLPTGRRGIKPISGSEIDIIFDPSKAVEFQDLASDWSARMMAPFTKQRRTSKVGSSPNVSDRQSDLFS